MILCLVEETAMRNAFHVTEIIRALDIPAEQVIPGEKPVIRTVPEGVCTGAKRHDGFARLNVSLDMTELLVVERQEPHEEDRDVRLLQHFQSRNSHFVLVLLGIARRDYHRSLEAEPLHLPGQHGHRHMRTVMVGTDNEDQMRFLSGRHGRSLASADDKQTG